MKNKLTLTDRIRKLKPGRSFVVNTKSERQAACRAAKFLRDAGLVEFSVVTIDMGDGTFKVGAI